MKVMKRMLALVLFVTLLVGLIPTTALEVKAKKIRTRDGWVLQHKFRGDYEDSYYVARYTGKAKRVTLPVRKDGYLEIVSMSDTVEEVHVPDGAEFYAPEDYADGLLNAKNLKKFTVSRNNEQYMGKDGVLFTKNKKTLACYPKEKKGKKYVVPNETEIIGVIVSDHLEAIELPKSLKIIRTIKARGIEKLFIPKEVNSITRIDIKGGITIDEKSEWFSMSDGVIFSKDKGALYYYPPNKKEDAYTIPPSVEYISGDDAFIDNRHLKTLRMPTWVEGTASPSIKRIEIFGVAEEGAYATISQSDMPKLEMIVLGRRLSNYEVRNGILYEKNKKELAWYPYAKRDRFFIIPLDIKGVTYRFSSSYLEHLYIHSGFDVENLLGIRLEGGWPDRVDLPRLRNFLVLSGIRGGGGLPPTRCRLGLTLFIIPHFRM